MNNRATVERMNRYKEVTYSAREKVDLNYLPTAEAAAREGLSPRTLQKRLGVDAKKPPEKRRYPGAYRCQCGHGWFVPEGDLNK